VREAVSSPQAPPAIGPYSQAIKVGSAGSLLFVSGQIPLDPETGKMVEGDLAAQTHRVFKNLEAILAASGASFDNVVKTTVYLADMNDFPAMNDIYATYFPSPAPARATVQAARLPRDARVEIDLIAAL
jgi:2-iminobutanoate/2-iminopropanoate deaminase